eukprot:466508-Pyramimonas_sp.AAC.1
MASAWRSCWTAILSRSSRTTGYSAWRPKASRSLTPRRTRWLSGSRRWSRPSGVRSPRHSGRHARAQELVAEQKAFKQRMLSKTRRAEEVSSAAPSGADAPSADGLHDDDARE